MIPNDPNERLTQNKLLALGIGFIGLTIISSNQTIDFSSNSSIGIGLYGEERYVYFGNNYKSIFNFKEKRNIHLGIDIFCKSGESFDLRWFTPNREVKLCGHATLASAFVIFNLLNYMDNFKINKVYWLRLSLGDK